MVFLFVSALFINIQINADSILSPLKQFKSGITIKDILCKSHLTLVLNHRDLPACVTSNSLKNLESRGWIKSLPSKIDSNIQNNSGNMTFINIKEKDQSNALSVYSFEKIISLQPIDQVGFRKIVYDWEGQFPEKLTTQVTDENNNLIAKDFLIQENLQMINVENYIIKFADVTPIPLKGKFSTILINDTLHDILPLDDGTYHLIFSSFSNTKINLPERAIILSNNTKLLPINFTDSNHSMLNSIFHHDVVFRLK